MVCRNRISAFLRVTLAAGLLLGLVACESVEDRIAGHLARGEAFVASGTYDKARIEFGNALKLDANNLAAHRAMAGVMEKTGNASLMLGHLNKVVEFAPQDVAARVKLAQILLFSEKLDAALVHINAALKAEPDNAGALATRASISLRLGNTGSALTDARRAVEIEPFQSSAGLVLISERMLAGDAAGALGLATEFSAANPDNLPLAMARLQILDSQKDMPGIGAQLKAMVAGFPSQPRLHVALAEWYQQAGDTPAALAEYRAYAAASPGDVPAALDLVRFVVRTQGIPQGRAELSALAGTPGAPFAFQLALAAFDYQNDRKEDAKTLLRSLAGSAATPADQHTAGLTLARFLISEGDRTSASALAETVLKADGKNAEALSIRAALRIDAGEIEAALTDLRTALGESPRNPLLLTLMAQAHQKTGNRTLAAENLAAAMQAAEYAETETLRYVAWLMGEAKTAQAETVLSEAVRRQPGNREMLTRLADLRLRLGDWAGAEVVAAMLSEDAKSTGMVDRIRAALLVGQERFGESVAVLEKLVADPDQRDSAMASLVGVYQRTGESAKAEAFLDTILKDNPKNVQALFLKGRLKEQAGDKAAAEVGYRALIEAAPEAPRAWDILAGFRARGGDVDAAVATLREGLARIPDDPLLDLRLAGFLEQKNDIDGAIALYEKLFAARPESLVVANNLVSLLTDHYGQDPEKVKRARVIAEALKGAESPQLQDSFGWTLHLSGESEAALRSLVPAAEALPDNPWVRYHIGMVYLALGRGVEAKGHLAAALEKAGEGVFAPRETIKAELAKLGG